MSLIHEVPRTTHDARSVKIVAKSLHRELVEGGFRATDVIALAGELLALVATGVRDEADRKSEVPTS
ncbi:MAG: hypothetical protein ACHREM_23395 [Polyangiales bacterium]